MVDTAKYEVIWPLLEDDQKDFKVCFLFFLNRTILKLQQQLVTEVECSLIDVSHTNY